MLISSEQDLAYDVITSRPATSGQIFQEMCQIDSKEGTKSFVAIWRFLRKLFTKKNMGGPFDPHTSASVKIRALTITHFEVSFW